MFRPKRVIIRLDIKYKSKVIKKLLVFIIFSSLRCWKKFATGRYLSSARWIHFTHSPPYFVTIKCNSTLPSTPRASEWSPFGPSSQQKHNWNSLEMKYRSTLKRRRHYVLVLLSMYSMWYFTPPQFTTRQRLLLVTYLWPTCIGVVTNSLLRFARSRGRPANIRRKLRIIHATELTRAGPSGAAAIF